MYFSQVAQCWPFSGCGFLGCFRATLAMQITSTKCCSFDRQPKILQPIPLHALPSAEVPFLSRKSKASPQAILWNLLANFSSSSQESLFLMWFFVCSSGSPNLPPPTPPSLLSISGFFLAFLLWLIKFCNYIFRMRLLWQNILDAPHLFICLWSFLFSTSASACASSYSYLLSRSTISTSSSVAASVSAAVFDIKWRA